MYVDSNCVFKSKVLSCGFFVQSVWSDLSKYLEGFTGVFLHNIIGLSIYGNSQCLASKSVDVFLYQSLFSLNINQVMSLLQS